MEALNTHGETRKLFWSKRLWVIQIPVGRNKCKVTSEVHRKIADNEKRNYFREIKISTERRAIIEITIIFVY